VELAGPDNARRLIISSTSSVRNPMVAFLVNVECPGANMSREYLALADYPAATSMLPANQPIPRTVVTTSVENVATDAASGSARADETLIARQTNLNTLARALYPTDRAARDQYRARIAQANPALFGGKENVGSIAIPAGTRLLLPAGTSLPPAANEQVRPAESKAGNPPGANRSGIARNGSDRLNVGQATPQLQMLADAIMRLEGANTERDKVTAELVGGITGSLKAIVELKERLGTQDGQLQNLLAMQLEIERQRALDRQSQPGFWSLVALIFGAALAGAALIGLHHYLGNRRRVAESPLPAHYPFVESPFAARSSETELPNEQMQGAQATPVERSPDTAASASSELNNSVLEANLHDTDSLSLDDLMSSFDSQREAVHSMIVHLQASGSRDPAEWLSMLNEARLAGLLNSVDMQQMVSRFGQIFNGSLNPASSSVSLDEFPHVTATIAAAWGRFDGLKLLSSLIYDDRDGQRSGFPEVAFSELLFLRELLSVRLAMFGDDPEPQVEELITTKPRANNLHEIDFALDLPLK
jgi:hypothetical protein